MISTGLFLTLSAAAIGGFIFLVAKLQKENSDFIDELQFALRQRILAHNKVKAQLAVLRTQYAHLKVEVLSLRHSQNEQPTAISFSGLLGEAEFVEVRKQKIEALEKELHTLKNMKMPDLAS
jgi:hypothetical protein